MTRLPTTSPGLAEPLRLLQDAETALRVCRDQLQSGGNANAVRLSVAADRAAESAISLRTLIHEGDFLANEATLVNDSSRPVVVLLVDAEAMIRRLGERVLAQHGYNVIATDSEMALAAFDRDAHRISLVVLDVGQPSRRDLALLHEVVRRSPTVRVVLSSGSFELMSDANLPQVCGLLPKPYRPSNLVAAVLAALAKK